MDLKRTLTKLFKIAYVVIIIYVAYQLIDAIIGGTWAAENIIIAGMGIILAGMFAIAGFLINQAKCLGKLEERTKNIGESLAKLGNDFKMHAEKPKK